MSMTRRADAADGPRLVELWALSNPTDEPPWRDNALAWFLGICDDEATAHFPVLHLDDQIVATAVGTLELGVPNPQCPRGRAVKIANVATDPAWRGQGFGGAVVQSVIDWARSIDADRLDLSATPDGQRLYERLGFAHTAAPRMKLLL